MALITFIPGETGEPLGIIETAVSMDALLPGLFSANEQTFLCLVDDAGVLYYDQTSKNPWAPHAADIAAQGLTNTAEETYTQTRVDGQDVILVHLPLPDLRARLVMVTSLAYEYSVIHHQRLIFYSAMVAVLLTLIWLINQTVKRLLKRFYGISHTVGSVRQGDLSVRVSVEGHDEVAEMGAQINGMLETINTLMDTDTKREIIMKNTEIRALQNQINAHFIYNVLEAIKMMAEIDERFQIADAVTSLGSMLRYSMRWTSRNVSIEEEIEHIRNYVSLTNLRYDHQICLSLSIPDPLWKQEIPKMSLQPIVENAICHGLELVTEDAYVYIKAKAEGARCVIEISDPGRGMDAQQLALLQDRIRGTAEPDDAKGGIGLKNVQERIQGNFGDEYGITIQSKEGLYTKVSVVLPLTRKGAPCVPC
jgi:two-component system sensor histidine kinase YesM